MFDEGELSSRRWTWRVEALDVPAFRKRQRQARAEGRYLGIGFATFSERTGYGTPAFAARGMGITPGWETVELTMDPSGYRRSAHRRQSPHGQGLRTTLAQIIADEIGVAPERIKVVHGDTDRTPYGWGTFASRSLVIAGGASVLAARKVRAKLIDDRQPPAGGRGRRYRAGGRRRAGGRHRPRDADRGPGARGLSPDRICFKGEIEPGLTGERAPTIRPAHSPMPVMSAIVEVDAETGRVTIERFVVAEDAGRLDQSDDRRRPGASAASRKASATRCWKRSSTTRPATS